MMSWHHQSILPALNNVLENLKDNNSCLVCIRGEQEYLIPEAIFDFYNEQSENIQIVYWQKASSRDADIHQRILRRIICCEPDIWNAFLEQFEAKRRNHLQSLLADHFWSDDEIQQIIKDIFYDLMRFISQEKILVFVLEEIDMLDKSGIQKFLDDLNIIKSLKKMIILTENSAGLYKHRFSGTELINLERLTVQQVEELIRNYFATSQINARVITNHCYLKTSGSPLWIRFLLESHYRGILNNGETDFVNLAALQQLRLPNSFANLIEDVLNKLSDSGREFVPLLAHLNCQVSEPDLKIFTDEFSIDPDDLEILLNAGLLNQKFIGKQSYFSIALPEIKIKVKELVLPEMLRVQVNKILDLQKQNKLSATFSLSTILYEMEDIEASIDAAQEEAYDFLKRGELSEAAERFYFLVRISRINPLMVKNIAEILEKLGDTYIRMGAMENGFEMLRNYRDLYIPTAQTNMPDIQKKWLDINLKIVHALMRMDAYQEARYLIREMYVKDFCDTASYAKCFEFLGDIERDLQHTEQALKHYLVAHDKFMEAGNTAAVQEIYFKIKKLSLTDSADQQNYLDEINARFGDGQNIADDQLNLLRELIKNELAGQNYDQALVLNQKYEMLVQKIYNPAAEIQVAFNFAEIYVHLNRWDEAVQYLLKLIEAPNIQYRGWVLVNAYIQVGMIYKEQAQFGKADEYLSEALQIAQQQGRQKDVYEIKLHLGHMHLLVHNLLRARDYLVETHRWAEKNWNLDIIVLSKLYLAYYEIRHKKFDIARKLFSDAKKILNVNYNREDFLNYLYYFALWLLEQGKADKAKRVIEKLQKSSADRPRYQAASAFLLSRVAAAKKEFESVEQFIENGLMQTEKLSLPQLRYLLLCEKVRIYAAAKWTDKFVQSLQQCFQFIKEIADKIEDPILQTQFMEARYHQDILNWVNKG